jgi:hypothetical protein
MANKFRPAISPVKMKILARKGQFAYTMICHFPISRRSLDISADLFSANLRS